MDCYSDIIKRCEKELEDLVRSPGEGFQNMEALKKADLCMHTIKSAYGAMAMMDQYGGQGGGYSQRMRGGYSRGGGYEIDPPATHDRMGRLPGYAYGNGGGYSRGMDSGNGYSYESGEDFARSLEMAMQAAPTEQERESIRQMLQRVKR